MKLTFKLEEHVGHTIIPIFPSKTQSCITIAMKYIYKKQPRNKKVKNDTNNVDKNYIL